MEAEIQKKGEVILYHPSETIKLEVRLENETVWLTQAQMAELFQTTRNNITLHIKNIFKEQELLENSVCKDSLLTASDGKIYHTKIYNLDVIISVGYRVKSIIGTKFRQWALEVLKAHLLKGYSVNNQLIQMEQRFEAKLLSQHDEILQIKQRLDEHDEQIAFFIRTNQPPIEGIFYEGQVLDARDFAETLIKSAQKEVLLIDNYIDARTFEILEVRGKGVAAAIYVERVGNGLRTLQQVSAQQTNRQIELRETPQRIHDRFLIIDDVVYHLGASLNELGRRLFAFSKMSIRKEHVLLP